MRTPRHAPTPRRARLAAALACLALGAGACGGGDAALDRIAELEADLEDRGEALDTLRSRVEELEAARADDDTDGEDDPLAELRTRVSALREDLDRVDATVAEGESSRSQAIDDLRSDVVTLDQKVGQLQGSISALTERVDLLTDELNSLEAQFKSHDHGG